MTNFLLFGVIICQLLPLLFALIAIKRLKSSLSRNVLSFFEAKSKTEQSSFADMTDQIASRFAAAITASVKGFLMAENSGAVRAEKAAARQQMMEASPLLQGLQAFAPGLIKKFGKNPEMLQMGLNLLQNAAVGPREEARASSNGGNHSDPFKI